MKDLVDTTEMYLRTIYELEEEDVIPLRARIAERLDQSGPTVSQTVARMERDGLVTVASDRSLKMSATGRKTAIAVMRKHRLAERLLADILHLDIHLVHQEACRWEHVMSDDAERRIVEILDDYHYSPFGNPIPGLEDLGYEGTDTGFKGTRASDLPADEPTRCRMVSWNEILQTDREQFKELTDADIWIDSEVTVTVEDGRVKVEKNGNTVRIAADLGHAIRVEVLED